MSWARLGEIEVQDFRSSPDYVLMPDSGIDILGFVRGGRERVSGFIGLGEGPEGDRLLAAVGDAVKKAGGVLKE